MDIIEKAIQFATKKHEGQFRKYNNEPYIVHPIEVYNVLRRVGVEDRQILAASLLHDVIEDCDVTTQILTDEFGQHVCSYVMAATKCDGKNRAEKNRRYLKYLSSFDCSFHLIKIADRTCNLWNYMDDWSLMSENEQYFVRNVYFIESVDLYDTLFDINSSVEKQRLMDLFNTALYKLSNF